jgi:hypothetical protein
MIVSCAYCQHGMAALRGAQADRGVFITTSRFTPDATDYAERVAARLVLIDGHMLAELMVERKHRRPRSGKVRHQADRRRLLRRCQLSVIGTRPPPKLLPKTSRYSREVQQPEVFLTDL